MFCVGMQLRSVGELKISHIEIEPINSLVDELAFNCFANKETWHASTVGSLFPASGKRWSATICWHVTCQQYALNVMKSIRPTNDIH